jgi:hypothetical protein
MEADLFGDFDVFDQSFTGIWSEASGIYFELEAESINNIYFCGR